MHFLPVTAIFSFISLSLSQQCPSIYLRYSSEHSFCKPRNTRCPIFKSGVSETESYQIVDIHNKYRSKVATGKERSAGGLPTAADMMQMVWDKELAAVAQKRAEQCIYAHDCSECRAVENFSVGQNIAYREMQCSGPTRCPMDPVPNWAAVIKDFYDEVGIFDKKYVQSMVFIPGKKYGHFTQIVWSTTWRIGCGFVAFKKSNGYRQLYVCNYGPGGNTINQPMYKIGPFCSSCPMNSCCGRSCGHVDYEGLCRMYRNEAPVYTPQGNYLLYCDFKSFSGDCGSSIAGVNKWRSVNALGGSFSEIILKGGESSTMVLKNTIKPKQNFCFVVKYRSGPTLAGQKSAIDAKIVFQMNNMNPVPMKLPGAQSSQQFFQYSIDLGWSYETKVSFSIAVPKGASSQFFNIMLVSAKNGRC